MYTQIKMYVIGVSALHFQTLLQFGNFHSLLFAYKGKHVQTHLELCSKTCRERLLLPPLGHWYVYIMVAYTTRGGHATLVDIGEKTI